MAQTAAPKALPKVKLKKPLPVYGGETLPAGIEITLTHEWEKLSTDVLAHTILDPAGRKRLVLQEDLDHAMGAH